MYQNVHTQGNPFGNDCKYVGGLCIHPVTMRHYVEWLDAKPVLTIRLSSLPPQYAVLPYASAIFKMETASMVEGAPIGLLARFVRLLCLSLQIPNELATSAIRFVVNRDDMTSLQGISIFVPQEMQETVHLAADGSFRISGSAIAKEANGVPVCTILEDGAEFQIEKGGLVRTNYFYGEFVQVRYYGLPSEPTAVLKPYQIDGLRAAIAEVNGERLPNEAENTELVEALQQKNDMSGAILKPSISDLLDSVAMMCGVRVQELADWTVREFEQRKRSIERTLRYIMCGIGEMQGAKWKNGNPYPSWCFERDEGMYGGFTPVSDIMGKLGSNEGWLNAQIEAAQNNEMKG